MEDEAYKVLLESRAERDLAKLEENLKRRIVLRLLSLRSNPRPAGVKKLEGSGSAWRLRVGDWRIIYEIHDRHRQVLVFRVKHRREVY